MCFVCASFAFASPSASQFRAYRVFKGGVEGRSRSDLYQVNNLIKTDQQSTTKDSEIRGVVQVVDDPSLIRGRCRTYMYGVLAPTAILVVAVSGQMRWMLDGKSGKASNFAPACWEAI